MIFFIDNDSTLMQEETFDELIKTLDPDLYKKALLYTHASMDGKGITLQDTLRYRIECILGYSKAALTKSQISTFSSSAFHFSDGVLPFLHSIIDRYGTLKNRVFILSGGFFECIAPALNRLSIPESEKEVLCSQLYCNYFLWNDADELIGIDWEKSQMWKEGAKRHWILYLQSLGLLPNESWIAIGDGSNDVGMIESDDEGIFYAFTGVVRRPNTLAAANGNEVKTFADLIPMVKNMAV